MVVSHKLVYSLPSIGWLGTDKYRVFIVRRPSDIMTVDPHQSSRHGESEEDEGVERPHEENSPNSALHYYDPLYARRRPRGALGPRTSAGSRLSSALFLRKGRESQLPRDARYLFLSDDEEDEGGIVPSSDDNGSISLRPLGRSATSASDLHRADDSTSQVAVELSSFSVRSSQQGEPCCQYHGQPLCDGMSHDDASATSTNQPISRSSTTRSRRPFYHNIQAAFVDIKARFGGQKEEGEGVQEPRHYTEGRHYQPVIAAATPTNGLDFSNSESQPGFAQGRFGVTDTTSPSTSAVEQLQEVPGLCFPPSFTSIRINQPAVLGLPPGSAEPQPIGRSDLTVQTEHGVFMRADEAEGVSELEVNSGSDNGSSVPASTFWHWIAFRSALRPQPLFTSLTAWNPSNMSRNSAEELPETGNSASAVQPAQQVEELSQANADTTGHLEAVLDAAQAPGVGILGRTRERLVGGFRRATARFPVFWASARSRATEFWSRQLHGGASGTDRQVLETNIDDDPTYQQLIWCGGFIFGPMLFALGAFLYFLTPRELRKTRLWGLVNLIFATLSIGGLLLYSYNDPAFTMMERVDIYTPPQHTSSRASSFSMPGSILLLQRGVTWKSVPQVSWMFSDPLSQGEWTPAIDVTTQPTKSSALSYNRIFIRPDDTAKPDHTVAANSGRWVLGPAIGERLSPSKPKLQRGSSPFEGVIWTNIVRLTGRILVTIEFGWGGIPTQPPFTAAYYQKQSDPLRRISFAGPKLDASVLSDDAALPDEFLGAAVRCTPLGPGRSNQGSLPAGQATSTELGPPVRWSLIWKTTPGRTFEIVRHILILPSLPNVHTTTDVPARSPTAVKPGAESGTSALWECRLALIDTQREGPERQRDTDYITLFSASLRALP